MNSTENKEKYITYIIFHNTIGQWYYISKDTNPLGAITNSELLDLHERDINYWEECAADAVDAEFGVWRVTDTKASAELNEGYVRNQSLDITKDWVDANAAFEGTFRMLPEIADRLRSNYYLDEDEAEDADFDDAMDQERENFLDTLITEDDIEEAYSSGLITDEEYWRLLDELSEIPFEQRLETIDDEDDEDEYVRKQREKHGDRKE